MEIENHIVAAKLTSRRLNSIGICILMINLIGLSVLWYIKYIFDMGHVDFSREMLIVLSYACGINTWIMAIQTVGVMFFVHYAHKQKIERSRINIILAYGIAMLVVEISSIIFKPF